MNRLFGIPMGTLAAALVVVVALAIALVAALALRNRVFLRLGARNVTRRPARSALIVLGLMLGTAIISSALSTGDTMSSTIRSSVIDSLGQTDELVQAQGASTENVVALGGATGVRYFDQGVVADVKRALAGSSLVDGVATAIVEPVAVLDATSRQTEPRVTLFATDPASMAGFGEIRRTGGGAVSLGNLRAGEAYLNAEAAKELSARPGDLIRVFVAGRSAPLRVRAVVEYQGSGTDGLALLLPLTAAQLLLGHAGQVKYVLVSNAGGATSGARHSDAVVRILNPVLAPLGLEADPAKKDGLDLADQQGNVFMSFFTTFGTFSIAAGVLLIFLIFVMLATERRAEMGIARAVGTRRGHLVQMFLYEGVVYDLAAAAVGALLGVGVAYGMVLVLAQAFGSQGLEIHHAFRVRSLVVGYCLGVLVTFLVVTFSAWRVSVLNIVAAIRNLPEPLVRRTRRFRFAWAGAGLLLGALLVVAGVRGKQMTPFMLGISIAFISLVPLVRAVGLPERAAYTVAGVALVALWLLPFDTFESLIPGLGMNFTVWIVGGLMVVVGATWLLVYNADVLLGTLMTVFGRVRSLAPVLKLAAAYPLRSRFRTGTTLAMFTLVVYVLVVGATTNGAFRNAFNDVQEFGGGFDVRADIAASNPVGDMTTAISRARDLDAGDFRVVAAQSFLPVEAKQAGFGKFEDYVVRGLDGQFLAHTTFGLAATARGYGSAEQVWHALATTPGLAVVDPYIVPRRANFNFGVPPAFRLKGFYLEDETFTPVPIAARDPQTGRQIRLTVIGVLKDTAPLSMMGISTSQRTLASLGDRVRPTVYYFKLAPGADPKATAKALETAFLANGMEADAISKLLADAVGASRTFSRLLQGFMGLGLVVGVAALGVISARSVVERRQQIGVLRSIGFQRRMVQASFLLESSFIALTAILVGTFLGLVTSYNVIADFAQTPSWENISFAVPWANLAIVFAVVYAASLAATFLPARRGSRVYPAEALRYQ